MKKLFNFKLEFNRNNVVATIAVTLLIMVDHYHDLTGSVPLDRFILFFLVPMFIIVVVLRENPADYGFRLGDWKAGLAMTGIVILVGAPILYFTAKGSPSMHNYYDHMLTSKLPSNVFLDLFGWEFMFRGWLLFGYARKYGPDALWLQAVPFALAHIGKPEVETLSTIFGGFLFGLVAWRSKSFIYAFFIHYFVFFFTVLVAGGFFG